MKSITENENRIGNFTSSKIHFLMTTGKGANGFGATGISYIEEVNLERKLGRSIDTDAYSKEMAWGSFLEARVEQMLEFGYVLVSGETDTHPTIKTWAGSKDFILPGQRIAELKCYQPKNFAKYTDALMTDNIDLIREKCAKEYWQAVSNAVLNNVPNAELISYMPYRSELPEIREMAENYDGSDQWKFRFIAESPDSSLAYLPDGGYYKNLNRFEFLVPEEDIELLSENIKKASTMLIPEPVLVG